MEPTFKCRSCNLVFEAEGVKVEYMSRIYGPCSKKIASCPQCKQECDEYVAPKPNKSQSNANSGCHGNCGCCGVA